MALPSESQISQSTQDDASLLPPLSQPTWHSPDYISYLAHIEKLQRQLHQIRLAPREVAYSLARPKESPEATMENYKDVSERAGKRIEEFKELWMKEETARMFVRCREIDQKVKSHGGSGKIGPSLDEALVPPYGWVEKKEAEEKGGLMNEGVTMTDLEDGKDNDTGTDGDGASNKEDDEAIVDSFKSEFSTLEWKPGSKAALQATIRCKGSILSFMITRGSFSGSSLAKPTYHVQVLGGGLPRELRELSECVNSRSRKRDLRYLLEFIMSYRNWRLDDCVICHEQIDRFGSHPLGRKELSEPKETGHPESRFVAIHKRCGEI